MKTTNEIKKMSAVELLEIFAVGGDKKNDSVGVDQNFDTETTTLLFEDCAIEINNSTVAIVDYYTPSENVSHVCERATRNQFVIWFLECNDWYMTYKAECEDAGIAYKGPTEYAEWLADSELDEWDGDQDYVLNIN